jgi:hypothetical protein
MLSLWTFCKIRFVELTIHIARTKAFCHRIQYCSQLLTAALGLEVSDYAEAMGALAIAYFNPEDASTEVSFRKTFSCSPFAFPKPKMRSLEVPQHLLLTVLI